MREVGAHDLPLAAAFDEDQRCAAVHDPHLAIFRHPGKRVISVGNPGIVIEDATGKLPKVEGARSQPLVAPWRNSTNCFLLSKR